MSHPLVRPAPRATARHRTRRHRPRRLLAAALAAVTCLIAAAVPSGGARPVPVGTIETGIANTLVAPRVVPGANNWFCRPTAAHPRPVVLVHGTIEAPALTGGHRTDAPQRRLPSTRSPRRERPVVERPVPGWATSELGPELAARGVRAPHHRRRRSTSSATAGGICRTTTSSGGGASKVHKFVALAPSNHGTTLSGLTEIGEALNLLGLFNAFAGVLAPSLVQQEIGSSFQQDLFGDGDTVPGPEYTVIATRHDIVVTPYTQAFLDGPNVENILIQDQCPTTRWGTSGSRSTGRRSSTPNELGPDVPGFQPDCRDYGIPL